MSQKGRADNLTYRGVLCAFVIGERKLAGAASDLFKLARKAESTDAWEAQCQIEEEWLLSDEAGQMKCVELPRSWVQAKSDIRGAWRAGLDLTKIPSYHKMKLLKAEANKAKREDKAAPQVQQETAAPKGEVTLEVVTTERTARTGEPRRERDAKPDNSLEVALESGQVVDAKGTLLMPEDLVEMCKFLDRLTELGRARLVKEFTKQAKRAYDIQCAERRKSEGARRETA